MSSTTPDRKTESAERADVVQQEIERFKAHLLEGDSTQVPVNRPFLYLLARYAEIGALSVMNARRKSSKGQRRLKQEIEGVWSEQGEVVPLVAATTIDIAYAMHDVIAQDLWQSKAVES